MASWCPTAPQFRRLPKPAARRLPCWSARGQGSSHITLAGVSTVFRRGAGSFTDDGLWLSRPSPRVTDGRGYVPGLMHDGRSVASRLHATTITRSIAPGCSRCSLGASHLVCAGRPFARMAVAMPVPGRNGCGSNRLKVPFTLASPRQASPSPPSRC